MVGTDVNPGDRIHPTKQNPRGMVYFKNPCKKHVIPPGFVGGWSINPGIDMPGYKDVNPIGFSGKFNNLVVIQT